MQVEVNLIYLEHAKLLGLAVAVPSLLWTVAPVAGTPIRIATKAPSPQ